MTEKDGSGYEVAAFYDETVMQSIVSTLIDHDVNAVEFLRGLITIVTTPVMKP